METARRFTTDHAAIVVSHRYGDRRCQFMVVVCPPRLCVCLVSSHLPVFLLGLYFEPHPPKTSITFFDKSAFTIALPIAGIAVAIDAPNN